MNNRENVFSAMVVILLLLLTAWGNATAMLVASALGCLAGFFIFRGHRLLSKLLLAVVAFAVSAAFAIDVALRRGR